jgi:uncharacterized repeat protein (TIGR01451 family)
VTETATATPSATPGAYPDLRVSVKVDRPVIKLGEIAWFTVDMRNVGTAPTGPFDVRNLLPPGFRVIGGTSRVDGADYPDPQQGARQALWPGFDLAPGQSSVLVFAVIAGPGAFPGSYPDSTFATDAATGVRISNIAEVIVRVDPEPVFVQSWVMGKVFQDTDGDGIQGPGEPGIAGARIASLDGQWAETDAEGRYHMDALQVTRRGRGTLFLAKLDPASLPAGSEVLSDNPRVLRLTEGLVQAADFAVRCPDCCRAETLRTRVLFDACSEAVTADGRRVLVDFVANLNAGARATLKLRGEALCPDELLGSGLAMRRVQSVREALAELGVDSQEGPVKVQVGAPRMDGVEEMRRQRWVLRPHFDSGRAQLKPRDLERIAQVASEVEGRVGAISVLGHTDDERLAPGTKAQFSDNPGLSRARARQVYESLRDALDARGIELPLDADVRGFGEDKPVANNRSVEGRALNRRVEVQIDSFLPTQGKPVYMDAELQVLRSEVGGEAARPCSCWQDAGPPEGLRLDLSLDSCALEPSGADARRLREALGAVAPGADVLLRLKLQPGEQPALAGAETRIVLRPRFGSGSADMAAESVAEIAALARKLTLTVRSVSVEGHSDSQALAPASRARFRDNKGLSQARAAAVEDVFVRALIDAERPVPLRGGSSGFGAERPVGNNATAAGRAANRRVELVLHLALASELNPCGPELPKRRFEALMRWMEGALPEASRGKVDLRIEEALEGPEDGADAQPGLGRAWLQRLGARLLGLLALAAAPAELPAATLDTVPPCVSHRLDPGRLEPKLSARLRQNPLWLPPIELPTRSIEVTEQVPVHGRQSLTYRFTLRPQFRSGTDDLDIGSLEGILDAARSVSGTVLSLSLVGHTDTQRLSGPSQARYGDNHGLSIARARAVGAIFLRGLAPESRPSREAVRIDGHGESQPLDPANTEAAWALNRRVEVEVLVSVDAGKVETRSETRQVTVTAKPQQPEFLLHCNYPAYVSRVELAIYGPRQGPPLRVLTATAQALNGALSWDWKDSQGLQVPAGTGYSYVLTVFNAEGRADRSRERYFEVRESTLLGGRPAFDDAGQDPREQRQDEAGLGGMQGWDFDADDTAERSIPLSGGTVVIVGQDLAPGSAVRLDDETAWADAQGRFVRERILPAGEHRLSYKGLHRDGRESAGATRLSMPASAWFLVGLAELTLGYGIREGTLELAEPADSYPEQVWADGRVAFFLKGKVKGRYLLTAQLDTGEEPVAQLLDRLDRKDPRQAFRRLDPDQYYPIYGDGSNTRMDVDSQGKFYLRLQSEQLQALWGNYQTDLRGGQLTGYQRALYGARVAWASQRTGADGRPAAEAAVFGAEALSAHGHDQLRSTGGLVYWLRHGDLVVGSERLRIEARDPGTGRVTLSAYLEPGRDYQLDWLQGRVILDRDLRQLLPSPSLAQALPASGDVLYLIADYEHTPRFEDAIEQGTVGGRASAWVLPQLQVGVMGVREGRNEPEARVIGGLDARALPAPGLTLSAEVAASQRRQGTADFSADGGLSYQALPDLDRLDNSLAHRVGLQGDLEPWMGLPLRADAEARYLEQGYSAPGLAAPAARQGYHGGVEAGRPGGAMVRLRVHDDSELGYSHYSRQSLGVELPLPLSLTAQTELSRQEAEDLGYDPLMQTLLALRLNWAPDPRLGLWAGGQGSMARSDGTPADHQAQAGLWLQLTRKLRATLDGRTGSLGRQARVGLEGRVDEQSVVYGSLEQRQDLYSGRGYGSTVGTRWQLGERWRAYAEDQRNVGEHEQGLSRLFGVGWQAHRALSLSADYTQSRLQRDAFAPVNLYAQRLNRSDGLLAGTWAQQPALVERDVVGAGLAATLGPLQFSQKAQLRMDRGGLDLDQVTLSSFLDWQLSDAFAGMAKLTHSQAHDLRLGETQARFTESGVGLAYRPTRNNRLNVVGKYSWLDELSPFNQLGSSAFETQSHVLSLEGILQLPLRFEVGQKTAFKRSATREARLAGRWLESDTWLSVTRLGYHLTRKVDAYAEYRRLWNTLSQSQLSGWLIGGSVTVQKHVELGAGFNFTDFNDDLVRLSYRAYGPFIQVVGKW